jgi:hypothetical protein
VLRDGRRKRRGREEEEKRKEKGGAEEDESVLFAVTPFAGNKSDRERARVQMVRTRATWYKDARK